MYPAINSYSSTSAVGFKIVACAITCIYAASIKSSTALLRYYYRPKIEYNALGSYESFKFVKGAVWLPKVASTFLSQSVKYVAIKATEAWIMTWDLSDEVLQYALYIPPMVGCVAMYEYRFIEASWWRAEYPLKISSVAIVAIDGVIIGYVGNFVKGTPFSKLPNIFYDFSGIFYDPSFMAKFHLLDKVVDVIETIGVASWEMVVKYYTKEQQVMLDNFADSVQEYCFPTPSQDQTGAVIVEQQQLSEGKHKTTIKFTQEFERCDFLQSVYFAPLPGGQKYPSSKVRGFDYYIEQEEEFEAGGPPIDDQCFFPCIDKTDCASVFRVYNSTNHRIITELSASSLISACPGLANDLGRLLHGLVIDCAYEHPL